MNDRIRELIHQELGPVATIGNWGRVDWADNVFPQLGDKMYAAIDLQKFAELIVRECSAYANHFSDGHEKDQFGRKMFHYTADIGQDILEYFGVEQ